MKNRIFDVSRLEKAMMRVGAVQAVAVEHQLTHWLNKRLPAHPESDRGAVSLEQVLWFAAAGVAAAAIAGVLWAQIMTQAGDANKSITTMTAPKKP